MESQKTPNSQNEFEKNESSFQNVTTKLHPSKVWHWPKGRHTDEWNMTAQTQTFTYVVK